MYLLSMLTTLALCGWVIVSTCRKLSDMRLQPAWFIAALCFALAGVALGFWFVSITYLASPMSKVYGWPFGIAGADFVGGRWLTGGIGRYMPLPFITDIALGLALCLLPLRIFCFVRERPGERGKTAC